MDETPFETRGRPERFYLMLARRKRSCPFPRDQLSRSPFFMVLANEEQESMVCSFEYAKYAVMPDTEKPRQYHSSHMVSVLAF